MMIEGSGSIPLTSGSGSGRPKNMWIRWIRIRNTFLVTIRLSQINMPSLKFVVLPVTHVVLHIEGDDVDELCGTARGKGGKLVPTTHKPD
jgi:hypothetical protein